MDRTEHNALPAMVTDYIDAVINKMRYRKSVRDEVRQELADHFADALTDCDDEQAKQEQAKELIEEFGDAKLLGVLLRRAKKRCRPLWRTMIVRMFQAVGVLFLLLVLYIGWFISGKPVITTNYLEVMNRQVRPAADDSQNAWPYYQQAAETFIEPIDNAFDKSPRPLSTLSPEHREVLLQWLDDNQESLDLIRQGNQKPYYWQVYGAGESETNELLSMLMPHLGDYRSLARIMCWQALLKAEDDDVESAFDDVFEVYSFGRRLRGHHTTLVEQLVAISIEAMAVAQLRTIADAHLDNIDASLLNDLRQRLQQETVGYDFRVSYKAEIMFFYDELQRSFTQTRFGKSHIYLQRVRKMGFMASAWKEDAALKSWLHFLFTHPDRDETLALMEHYYDVFETLSRKTPASRRETNIDIDQQLEKIAEKNLLLKILTPALGKVTQLSYRIQADSVATLAVLAVLQVEKTHGAYPESLAAVVEAGLLDALPMDPFSDEPLVHRRSDDGFTLYSVGSNFTDDGGAPSTGKDGTLTLWGDDGDAVFWPVADRG